MASEVNRTITQSKSKTRVKKQRPIVLVGLMGAGKSTVGQKLAESLKIPFVDSDHTIEKEQKATVSEIFDKKGERYFRKLERQVISRYLQQAEPVVLATGGGAFIEPATRKLIKKKGRSVWLRAEFDTLLERVSRKKTRPLLEKGDKAAILKDLMEKRYPVYAQSDIVVDTTTGPHERVVEQIVTALKTYGTRKN
ncbi:MAG: shikimate kinase [Proteobacteria bacterium]|nr:shikimate kinase [Pseudomonadota bacterium]